MKPLHEQTKEELINCIQDYQEMTSEIEHEVNMTIGRFVGIDPGRIREIMNRWLLNPPRNAAADNQGENRLPQV